LLLIASALPWLGEVQQVSRRFNNVGRVAMIGRIAASKRGIENEIRMRTQRSLCDKYDMISMVVDKRLHSIEN
jgi:hypothetical protein